MPAIHCPYPPDWFDAFDLLATLLKKKRSKRLVIFIDEFPWIHTPKSNFLAAFENFWNTWAAEKPNVTVIVCGSAASWMIQKVIRNKGGLHNRITHKMVLQPFCLYETELFLKSRGVQLNYFQIIQLYMAVGGIPQYLEIAKPGKSAAQIIDEACFQKNGFLYDEFNDRYRRLDRMNS
jgi:predicted AAA+ superfamily ATPase